MYIIRNMRGNIILKTLSKTAVSKFLELPKDDIDDYMFKSIGNYILEEIEDEEPTLEQELADMNDKNYSYNYGKYQCDKLNRRNKNGTLSK